MESDDYKTPLHIACEDGEIGVVAHLLKKGEDVNIKCHFGYEPGRYGLTPLHFACKRGHLEIVKLLVNTKANLEDIYQKDHFNQGWSLVDMFTPLQIAYRKGHTEIVKFLVGAGAEIDRALKTACKKGDLETVRLFIETEPYLDTHKAIFAACKKNQSHIIKFLSSESRNFDMGGIDSVSSFDVACEKGHLSIVKILLKKGYDPKTINKRSGNTPLHIACNGEYFKLIKLLIGMRADVNACVRGKCTPFHNACRRGNIQIVKLLVKNKADINCNVTSEGTPLHTACTSGKEEVVHFLVGENANIEILNSNKRTPLFIAYSFSREETGHTVCIREKYWKIVRLLIEADADIDSLWNTYRAETIKLIRPLVTKRINRKILILLLLHRRMNTLVSMLPRDIIVWYIAAFLS